MDVHEIHIKNMVCDRCISTIKTDLEGLDIGYKSINLGTVELLYELTQEKKSKNLVQNQFLTKYQKHNKIKIQRKKPKISKLS